MNRFDFLNMYDMYPKIHTLNFRKAVGGACKYLLVFFKLTLELMTSWLKLSLCGQSLA